MSTETKGEIGPDLESLKNLPLLEDDGEPLETPWHRACMTLLIEAVLYWLRDRTDFYVGGNMFVYYSPQQAMDRDYRGPDFFFVKGVSLEPPRRVWAVWFEGGRLPDVIIELLSPTTAREDRTTKKDLYEQTFQTRNYFCYDPFAGVLEGWQLRGGRYEPLVPNERGWLWCPELQLWLGTWEGEFQRVTTTWLRWYDPDGQVVPIPAEAEYQRAVEERQRAEAADRRAVEERQRAEAERQRAEAERQRAEAAEAELARLRALLAQRAGDGSPGAGGPTPPG
jgi:Uma2 family endonuclease